MMTTKKGHINRAARHVSRPRHHDEETVVYHTSRPAVFWPAPPISRESAAQANCLRIRF